MSRILYLGQKPIGEQCWEKLIAMRSLTVCGVATNASFENWWGSASIWEDLEKLGIPFINNDQPNEPQLLKLCKSEKVDTIISVQHPHRLSAALLKAVGGEAYNLHLAPLPEYRGYNGGNFAILNQDKEFGVTLHKITEELDAGDIVRKEMFPIEPFETAESLYHKSEEVALKMFKRFLLDLKDGVEFTTIPQGKGGEFHGHRSLDAFKVIPSDAPFEQVERFSQALWFPPFEPAHFKSGERKLFVIPQWPIS